MWAAAHRKMWRSAAMLAAVRPAGRAAAMGAAAMGAAGRDMRLSTAMRTTAVKRRAAVEHGWAGAGRRCAMGRGCAMETLAGSRRRAAMRGRRAMVRRFAVKRGNAAAVDRRRRAETPAGPAGLAAHAGNVRGAAKSGRRGRIPAPPPRAAIVRAETRAALKRALVAVSA